MEVVRSNGLQAQVTRDAGKLMVQFRLRFAMVGGNALVLKFDIEVARLEARRQLTHPFHGVLILVHVEQTRDDAGDASRGTDDALAVLLQHGIGGARLVVEVVDVRFADEVHQIVVALVVLGQQHHVVQLGLAFLLQLVVGGEVDFAAKDGLDLLARFLFQGHAGIFEFGHATHNAVVGNGNGRHAQISRTLDHGFYLCGAVEQGIFRVIVQMNKRHNQTSSLRA